MAEVLNLLCAGAAQGLVKALQERFTGESGAAVQARFGAVGAMQEALRGGAPCDALIATHAMIVAMQGTGELASQPPVALGRVRTGIAVRTGAPLPAIATPETLKASLLAAGAIHFPDPQRSTAGVHFAALLDRMGIRDAVQARVHTWPNGAAAMRELAARPGAAAIGCTQISEILYTPGIELVGPLPAAFELATVYTAAVSARAARPALAQRFIELLAGPATRALRTAGGFEAA